MKKIIFFSNENTCLACLMHHDIIDIHFKASEVCLSNHMTMAKRYFYIVISSPIDSPFYQHRDNVIEQMLLLYHIYMVKVKPDPIANTPHNFLR